MKLSILIPTRNRLDLLKYAVTSVLKQNYQDWEMIISDNASDEDIEGYVQSLNESRIKYSRSEKFLSVTENWNRCTDLCTGDYVIMIGDDDIFLKNHFQIVHNLIEKFENPDLIYTNAFLYIYPNVLPNFPQGTFQTFGSLYGMPKHEVPFWLDHSSRRTILQELLEFRTIYSTNMQHAVISRSLLEKVKREGLFFYSPYPDIYAMGALFHEADRILIYPKELVVIGVTSKSHGGFAMNKKEKEAAGLLNIGNEMSKIATLQSVLLPGSSVFTFWLGSLELLKLHFPLQKHELTFDYNVYRKIQINYALHMFLDNKKEFRSQFNELMSHLTLSEKISIVFPSMLLWHLKKAYKSSEKILPKFLQKSCRDFIRLFRPSLAPATFSSTNPPPGYVLPNAEGNKFSNVLEIYEQVEPVDCSH